ncbi:MAG TPA: hypothetical protein VF626_05240 [Chthoniobacterales bacterium]|jgi:hypothetical protein
MKTSKSFALIAALCLPILAASQAAAASPFKKTRGGLYHVSSGVIFPSRVGAFRFGGTHVYGSAGRDVGAQYNVVPVIRGDVYVYPLGTYARDFNGELRVQQNDIKRLNAAVKQVSQSRLQLNQAGRRVSGIRVQYELTRQLYGKKRRCGSQLYLFRDGRWLFQYRFSYPIEQTGLAQKQMADFLRLWQWRTQGMVTQLEPISSDGRNS